MNRTVIAVVPTVVVLVMAAWLLSYRVRPAPVVENVVRLDTVRVVVHDTLKVDRVTGVALSPHPYDLLCHADWSEASDPDEKGLALGGYGPRMRNNRGSCQIVPGTTDSARYTWGKRGNLQ